MEAKPERTEVAEALNTSETTESKRRPKSRLSRVLLGVGVGAAVLIILCCAVPVAVDEALRNKLPIPGVTYPPTPSPGDVQVNEPFNGAYTWPSGRLGSDSVQVSQGRLSLMAATPGQFVTIPFLSMTRPTDYSIEIGGGSVEWLLLGNVDMAFDVTIEQNARGAVFGAACRVQDNNGTFYGFVVYEDGSYGIGKTIKEEPILLVTGPRSAAIRAGGATNAVRVICNGDQLVLEANGTELARATDTELRGGIVALLGGMGEDPGITIEIFDNLVIRAP